jgi:hypothetical protein
MRAFCSALLLFLVAACAPPARPVADPALWRIADADSEIWLFGTVHVLPPELEWQSARVRAAFASADEFVTETDARVSAGADPELVALIERFGLAPPGERLSARLSPEDQRRLARTAREIGVDLAVLDGMRPWFAALQISYAQAARAGHRPEAGVEAVLAAQAEAQGKRLSFFETPEEQVRVLADLPDEVQLHFLSVTLRQSAEDATLLTMMDRAWVEGDVATLQRMLDAEWREGGPEIHEALLLRRNRAWADEIAARLDGSGRIFIAVGAAHLLGDGSVVDLLRERGIAVEGP